MPTKDDLRSVQQAARDLCEASLSVKDMMGVTVDEIVGKARLIKETGALGYLVVDNYQKLVNEAWDVERIFKTLKKLAIELEIPILILSKPATCPDCDDEYFMSDVADRKVIEKYVELIGAIEWSGAYSNDGKTHLLLHISRNRSGVKGCVELWFDGSLHRLEPVYLRIDMAEVENMFLLMNMDVVSCMTSECGDMSPLCHWPTCRPVGKLRHVGALYRERSEAA